MQQKVVLLTIGTGESASVHPAIVLSLVSEAPYNGANNEPAVNAAFLHPKRVDKLQGSDWRGCFDRLSSVKHKSHPDVAAGRETFFYVDATVEEIGKAIESAGDRYLAARIDALGVYINGHYPTAVSSGSPIDDAIAILEYQNGEITRLSTEVAQLRAALDVYHQAKQAEVPQAKDGTEATADPTPGDTPPTPEPEPPLPPDGGVAGEGAPA